MPKPPTLFVPVGHVSGYLTVTGPATLNVRGHRAYPTRCVCGECRLTPPGRLLRGQALSCGCKTLEASVAAMRTHGASGTPEGNAWRGMIERCFDKDSRYFRHYGGRGISVCAAWAESFDVFLKDMGRRPSPRHSLDRFPNNDGNYEPSNCRWATQTQQIRNRRVTVHVEHKGQRRVLAELCEERGAPYQRTFLRVARGWDIERALSEPAHNNGGPR